VPPPPPPKAPALAKQAAAAVKAPPEHLVTILAAKRAVPPELGGWPCSDLSVEASVETPAGGPSDFGTLLAPPPLRPYDGRSCTPLYRSDRPVDGTHGPWGRDPLGAPPGMWSVPLPGPRPPARTASKMIICNR